MRRTVVAAIVVAASICGMLVGAGGAGAVNQTTLAACEPELDATFNPLLDSVNPIGATQTVFNGSYTLSGVMSCQVPTAADPYHVVDVTISGTGTYASHHCFTSPWVTLNGHFSASPNDGTAAFSGNFGTVLHAPRTASNGRAAGVVQFGTTQVPANAEFLPHQPECSAQYASAHFNTGDDHALDDAPVTDVPDPTDAVAPDAAPAAAADAPASQVEEDAVRSFSPAEDATVASLPEWVRALPVLQSVLARGIPLSDVTFYSNNVDAVAASSGSRSCPKEYVCLFRKAEFKGKRWEWPGDNNCCIFNLRDIGASDQISSWTNRVNDHAAALWKDVSGGGESHCLRPHTHSPHLGKFNDQASSFAISPNYHGECAFP